MTKSSIAPPDFNLAAGLHRRAADHQQLLNPIWTSPDGSLEEFKQSVVRPRSSLRTAFLAVQPI
jgi:hypothetical protein